MKRILFTLLPVFLFMACDPVDGEECDLEPGEVYCDGNTLIQCQGNSKGEKFWRVIECGKPYPDAVWEKAQYNTECVEFTYTNSKLKTAMCAVDKDRSDECKDLNNDDRVCFNGEYHACQEGYLQSQGGSCEN